jgi:hypothetical protein
MDVDPFFEKLIRHEPKNVKPRRTVMPMRQAQRGHQHLKRQA